MHGMWVSVYMDSIWPRQNIICIQNYNYLVLLVICVVNPIESPLDVHRMVRCPSRGSSALTPELCGRNKKHADARWSRLRFPLRWSLPFLRVVESADGFGVILKWLKRSDRPS